MVSKSDCRGVVVNVAVDREERRMTTVFGDARPECTGCGWIHSRLLRLGVDDCETAGETDTEMDSSLSILTCLASPIKGNGEYDLIIPKPSSLDVPTGSSDSSESGTSSSFVCLIILLLMSSRSRGSEISSHGVNGKGFEMAGIPVGF